MKNLLNELANTIKTYNENHSDYIDIYNDNEELDFHGLRELGYCPEDIDDVLLAIHELR